MNYFDSDPIKYIEICDKSRDHSKDRKGANVDLCRHYGVSRWWAAFHAHVRAIQANPLPACTLALLCYAIGGTGSLEKQVEMEEDACCKLWPGGCSLMGKCFLLQVRRTLVSCFCHVDSPRRRSARSYECNRSALVLCLIFCGEIYAWSGIAFHIRCECWKLHFEKNSRGTLKYAFQK